MPKKSKALRELEAMEAIEQQVMNASKARLEVIQALKDRMVLGPMVANPKTRRTSVRVGKPVVEVTTHGPIDNELT